MKIIGIDPGLKGGLSVLKDGELIQGIFPPYIQPMPTATTGVDAAELYVFLRCQAGDIAYIEKQQVRGNQRGNFTIGTNYGRILAVLEILKIPYVEVGPKVWQARILAAELYHCNGDTKRAAIMYCQNRGWEVPRRSGRADSPLNDGISDALCIAAYGAELARVEGMVVA